MKSVIEVCSMYICIYIYIYIKRERERERERESENKLGSSEQGRKVILELDCLFSFCTFDWTPTETRILFLG